MHWVVELHGKQRLFKSRGEGTGLFFSHILCFNSNYINKKPFLPCCCYGYSSDHCVGAWEQENTKRRGGHKPSAPPCSQVWPSIVASGLKFVQGQHLSIPDGNTETMQLQSLLLAASAWGELPRSWTWEREEGGSLHLTSLEMLSKLS